MQIQAFYHVHQFVITPQHALGTPSVNQFEQHEHAAEYGQSLCNLLLRSAE